MIIPNYNGVVVYDGPSNFDGSDIVVIVTGMQRPSNNIKTGPLLQSYIIMKDMLPTDVLKFNRDFSICGHCPQRGDYKKNSCYVNVGMSVNNVYNAYKSGSYVSISDLSKADKRNAFGNRYLRLGAYGDPAAVPYRVWEELLGYCTKHTGYTSSWRVCDQRLKHICMASIKFKGEMELARSMGWRTFRIRHSEADALLPGEFMCPASGEAGNTRICYTCMACDGLNGKSQYAGSPAIIVHGSLAKKSRFSLLTVDSKPVLV